MIPFICFFLEAFSHTSHLYFIFLVWGIFFPLRRNGNIALASLSEIFPRLKGDHLKALSLYLTFFFLTFAIKPHLVAQAQKPPYIYLLEDHLKKTSILKFFGSDSCIYKSIAIRTKTLAGFLTEVFR